MKSAHDPRLTAFMPIVLRLAKQFRKRLAHTHDIEDLIAIGRVGLWNATQSFDESRGVKFQAYAREAVFWRLSRELRNEKAEQRVVARHTVASLDATYPNGSPILVAKCERRPADVVLCLVEGVTSMRRAMAKLPERSREVLRMNFEEERSLAEIGTVYGFSRERARQIQAEALKTLRVAMERDGFCGAES